MDTTNRSDTTGRSRPDAFPLTCAQRGIWLTQRLAPDVPTCIAQYVEVRGALDLAVLDDASVTAGREFQSAFLRVFEIDGEPFQTVDPTIDLSTGFVDLGAEADPVAAAHTWMTRDYTAPLDPARDRLATSTVLRVGDDHYLWYSRIHHVALDGYGAMTLVNRIAALYTAHVEARTPEPAGAADLRTLHRLDEAYRSSNRYSSDRAYWREHLSGRRSNSSLSPTVAPAVAESILETGTLSASATERLDSSGERIGVPPATVVIATFGVYLARMTGRDDVLVELPVSGRTTVLLQRSGGMLVGLAPLQVSTTPDDTVATLTRRVHHEILGALRHQRFTLEDIRRDADAADSLSGPMVNVMLFRPRIRSDRSPETFTWSRLGRWRICWSMCTAPPLPGGWSSSSAGTPTATPGTNWLVTIGRSWASSRSSSRQIPAIPWQGCTRRPHTKARGVAGAQQIWTTGGRCSPTFPTTRLLPATTPAA